jgi:glycerol-3-phosphate acyltransferase PlsY
MKEFLGIILGYLIGSVPFSFIIAKLLKGVDLRKEGTRNVGASNVAMLVGKKAGFIALILDISKGVFSVILAQRIFCLSLFWASLSGFSAILGHNWPIFLNFKGGRGVACGMGVIAAIFPKEAPLLFLLLLTFYFIFHSAIFSLAIVSLFVPLIAFLFGEPLNLINISAAIVVFIHIRGFKETKQRYLEIKRRIRK